MAQAEENNRREAGAQVQSPDMQSNGVPSAVAPVGSVRGWEALKSALRHLVGSERGRNVPHIASAA